VHSLAECAPTIACSIARPIKLVELAATGMYYGYTAVLCMTLVVFMEDDFATKNRRHGLKFDYL
jgi:hypothetical protein